MIWVNQSATIDAILEKRSCFVRKTIANGLRIPSTLSEVWWDSIIPFFVAFNYLNVYFSFLAICLSILASFLFPLLCRCLLPDLNLECSPRSHKQQQQSYFPPRTFQWLFTIKWLLQTCSHHCSPPAHGFYRSPGQDLHRPPPNTSSNSQQNIGLPKTPLSSIFRHL